jgi:hypothetical protein
MAFKITATEMRDGSESRMVGSPTANSDAPFIAIAADVVIGSWRFSDIAHLPPETRVIACWHGATRTDGFITTVGAIARQVATSEAERRNANARADQPQATSLPSPCPGADAGHDRIDRPDDTAPG